MSDENWNPRQTPALNPNADLGFEATKDLSVELNALLADMFALHMKTKNFHWHVSGPHFRDYHAMLDEQAGQLYAATDVIAKRVRKLGPTHCGPSATFRGGSVCPTTMRTECPRSTCSPNCTVTTGSSLRISARRMVFARSMAMSRVRA